MLNSGLRLAPNGAKRDGRLPAVAAPAAFA
jgi:hypothetical protein